MMISRNLSLVFFIRGYFGRESFNIDKICLNGGVVVQLLFFSNLHIMPIDGLMIMYVFAPHPRCVFHLMN